MKLSKIPDNMISHAIHERIGRDDKFWYECRTCGLSTERFDTQAEADDVALTYGICPDHEEL